MNLSDRNPRRAVSAGSLKTNNTAAAAVAATGTGTTTQDCGGAVFAFQRGVTLLLLQ